MTEMNGSFATAVGQDETSLGQVSKTAAVPLLVTLIAVTMFLPEESSFSIGPLRLTVARLFMLLAAPATLYRFAQLFSRPDYRFVWDDALIPLFGAWMIIAPSLAESLDRGLAFGGSSALEFCIPYIAVRVFDTQSGPALKITKTILYGISVIGLLGLFDWATNEWFIRNVVSKVTGYAKIWDHATQYDWRLGLLRAASTIEHPILLGTVCAFGILLSTAYHGVSRWFITAGCLIGLMTALSSAPAGALVIGMALILYDRILRGFSLRWIILLSGILLVLTVIFIGSSNPWALIFSKICFDPTTADYRLMEWRLLWPFVMESPFVGYGTGQESLTDDLLPSIDSLWLRNAVFLGIPGMVLSAMVFLGCASIKIDTANPNLNLTPDEKSLALALNVVNWVSMFVATTTFYWGAIWILTGFLLGVRAHLGNLAVIGTGNNLKA